MKTTKWLLLGLSILFALSINAQTKAAQGFKITMQFEGETNAKTYECGSIVFSKIDESAINNKTVNYDMTLNCLGTPDQKQLEWFTNPNLKKSLKITVFRSGKKEREYLLKNTSVSQFSETAFSSAINENSPIIYDLALMADQIFIDGVQAKGAK